MINGLLRHPGSMVIVTKDVVASTAVRDTMHGNAQLNIFTWLPLPCWVSDPALSAC